jgi:hypothetical protein
MKPCPFVVLEDSFFWNLIAFDRLHSIVGRGGLLTFRSRTLNIRPGVSSYSPCWPELPRVGFQVSLLKTISLCVGVGRDDESVVIALAPIAPGGRGRSDGRRVKNVYLKVWAHGPRSSQIMHHDRIPLRDKDD